MVGRAAAIGCRVSGNNDTDNRRDGAATRFNSPQACRQASPAYRKETSLIGEHVFVPMLSEIKDGAALYEKIAVAFAQSESIDRHEVSFLLGYLEEQGWLKKPHREMKDKFILTVEGYARLAELDNVATDSSQGFVAMWFDDYDERGPMKSASGLGLKTPDEGQRGESIG